MKNYNEQLNEIRKDVINDIKELKNKVLFKGELSDLWELVYDLPQTYTISKYNQHITYYITEIKEIDGKIIALGIDNEEGTEETFNIYDLSLETLIDILNS
jgi:hypothetical protein